MQNDHTGKTQAYFQSKDIDITNLTSENYSIYWYVVKYHNDGWHVDGILLPKSSNTDIEPTPEPTPEPEPEPEPEPTIDPTPITTPDPVITEITDDETPLAPNPSDDVDNDTTVEPIDPIDIDDEDVPLSDGTDVDNEDISVIEEIEIDDEDVPLADLPEDDAEVTTIDDEDTPLSDNPLTGDNDSIFWAIIAIFSIFGLAIPFVTEKCKKTK